MSDDNIKKAYEAIETASSALRLAKDLLENLEGVSVNSKSSSSYADKAASLNDSGNSSKGRIVEGVFDGEKMIDKEGQTYPVPANYASKSKLVAGDVLKLTIGEDGRFVYKQIAPIPRKSIVGVLVHSDNGRYQVLSKEEGKAYSVLLASVTYFHAQVGDQITLVVAQDGSSDWGAIEGVLPKFASDGDEDEDDQGELNTIKSSDREAKRVKDELDIDSDLEI